MFEDYKKEVLSCYLEKREKEQLESFLQNPTTRKLKKACIRNFNTNPKRDERTLRLFFDPNNKIEDLERSIDEFDVEKFRPLLSFIKQEKNIRDEEPVKILAWLIGFESFKDWKEKKLKHIAKENDDFSEQQTTENTHDVSDKKSELEPENLTNSYQVAKTLVDIVPPLINPASTAAETNWFTSLNWKTWTATICSLIIAFIVFAYYKSYDAQQCMYWNGNEYKKISCYDKNEVPMLALNQEKLTSLKKIAKPDTITYSSIGKVWWAKVNGKVEFYTAGGDHPTIENKRLLPITKYMIDKYIAPLRPK